MGKHMVQFNAFFVSVFGASPSNPKIVALKTHYKEALTRRSRKCWRSSRNGGTCGNQNSSSTTVADSSAKSSSSLQSFTSTTSGDSARPISELASSTARYYIKTLFVVV